MSTQREAFEVHLNARGLLTQRWTTGPDEYYFSAAQEAWLASQLAQNGPGWPVLGQGSVLGPRDFKPAIELELT